VRPGLTPQLAPLLDGLRRNLGSGKRLIKRDPLCVADVQQLVAAAWSFDDVLQLPELVKSVHCSSP